MPSVSPALIIDEIINAVEQSGGTAAYVSGSPQTHPRKFLVGYQGSTYTLWVYIWTLTHGGRSSLPDEYRIQMTSVPSPLPKNSDGLTVLLGYHPDLKMFAGFHFDRHSVFTGRSPSVQINLSAIHTALQNGLSFVTKDNDEIAIGIRPDQFLAYCLNAASLHLYGADASLMDMLAKATEEAIPLQDIASLTADRQKIVENISRYSRDARFRKMVLGAYDNRCAVTRLQLKLVEAAHILPVPSTDSSDHVTNGLALSPTFHRAYDSRLIYLDENYVMRLNEKKVNELKESDLSGGLEEFASFLERKIHLPPDKNQRPRQEYILLANKHRRIPGYV